MGLQSAHPLNGSFKGVCCISTCAIYSTHRYTTYVGIDIDIDTGIDMGIDIDINAPMGIDIGIDIDISAHISIDIGIDIDLGIDIGMDQVFQMSLRSTLLLCKRTWSIHEA